jgi:hypothetical protein
MDIQLDCLFFGCDHTPDRKSDESGSIARPLILPDKPASSMATL